MAGRALTVWLIMVVIAILNGGFRNAVLTPWVGEHAAHLISTTTGCAAFLLLMWLTLPWIGARRRRDLVLLGVSWFILAVAFEFLAGHYLFGNSWEALVADYNVLRGRVWPVVLLVLLLGPQWVGRLRGIR